MGKQQVFIPVEITDISRGSRIPRMRETNTPRLENQNIRTPESVQERSGSPQTSAPPATHSGVESIWDAKPRVVVAFATRPGANFADPSGIKKLADKVESLKALAQSLIATMPHSAASQQDLTPEDYRDDHPILPSFSCFHRRTATCIRCQQSMFLPSSGYSLPLCVSPLSCSPSASGVIEDGCFRRL